MKRNTVIAVTGGMLAGVSLSAMAVLSAPSWANFGSASTASIVASTAGQVSLPAIGQVTRWGSNGNLADLVEAVSPSVVQIVVRQAAPTQTFNRGRGGSSGQNPFEGTPFEDFGRNFQFRAPGNGGSGEMPDRLGSGSGFFIDGGYIVTNNHVVDGAKKVTVRLDNGTELDATVVGTDEKTDVAVIKVADPKLRPALIWGDSDKARPGDSIFAVGSPFGARLINSVTAGIVSARGRQTGGTYDDYIQVDAPINQGNSGGPLFDQSGRVIGVNSAIYSPTGGNVGIGFSIPSNLAQGIVKQIIEHGSVERGWLGVSIGDVNPNIAKSMGVSEASGAFVQEVTADSPAQKAGFKERDIIVAFGDRKITHTQDLTRAVADTKAGTTKEVRIIRDGRPQTIRVKIEALVDKQKDPIQLTSADEPNGGLAARGSTVITDLGLTIVNNGGAVISDVKVNSPAADIGLSEGDKILAVGDTPVNSAEAVRKAVEAAKKQKREAVLLQVQTQQGKAFVGVPFLSD